MDFFKEKIMVVSSDEAFLTEHIDQLKKEFHLQQANSSEMGLFLCKEWEPSVVVLDFREDLNLFINPLREKIATGSLGLIILDPKQNLMAEERAFRLGADHYLSATCDYWRLVWRIQSLIKKAKSLQLAGGPHPASSTAEDSNCIEFSGVRIFPNDFLVKRNDDLISTTPTQFRLLVTFIGHQEQLLSRDWIRQMVWDNADISPRSIDAQISKLKKLIPELDACLMNIYGKGYVLTSPKSEVA